MLGCEGCGGFSEPDSLVLFVFSGSLALAAVSAYSTFIAGIEESVLGEVDIVRTSGLSSRNMGESDQSVQFRMFSH
jgi:hypothetical protein